jgi:hypothetical protein
MQSVREGKRLARGMAVALLILATALIAYPGAATANNGRGHAWGRHRVSGYATVRYAPGYRYSYGYRPYGYGYVSYYRPYRYVSFRPRYRVVVADPYCDDDDYYVRPVVVRRYHHHPRVGVSLMFSSGPGFYYGGYGDPYCDW